MKLVALNIRHGGGTRVPSIVSYLENLKPDVVVLSEFRENANAEQLRSSLASYGLDHFMAGSALPKENSVCIFSKKEFSSRTYPSLELDQHRVITICFDNLAILGVYFPQNRDKVRMFRFLLDGGYQPTEDAHIIIGDFNTGLHGIDESGKTFYCADQFAALPDAGLVDSWRTRHPEARQFSWYSNAGNGFRIDHAFSSQVADSRIKRIYYDHEPRLSRMTDHSALIIEYIDDETLAGKEMLSNE